MRRFTRGPAKFKTVLAALSLCALPLVPPLSPAAQGRRPPVERDARALRRALARALGGEFEIVRDELTRRSAYHGGGAYWLAHVRPKRAGSFTLKYVYVYEDPFVKSEPRATRAEHTFSFHVGPRGCWRRPEFMSSSFEPCLGDTIILPVALDAYRKNYSGHAFELKVHSISPPGAPAGPEKWEEDLPRQQDAGLDQEAVANPLAGHLKYLGRAVHLRPHRAPGYTAEFHATFEAVRPGRFNVSLGAAAPGEPHARLAGGGPVPVIVVERGTPVTWLAAQGTVVDRKGRFSSHYGENYLTTPVIMQPGERLTLPYHRITRRGLDAESRLDERGLGRSVAPVITRLPFRVEPGDNYNEWIIEHLPD